MNKTVKNNYIASTIMELRAKSGQKGEIVTWCVVKMVAKRPTTPNSDVNFITEMAFR